MSWVNGRVLLRHTAGKIVSRLRNAALVSALNGWRSWATESLTVKSKLRKAVMRMELGGLSSAMEAWKEFAKSSLQMKSAASRVISRMRSAAVAGAFDSWCEYWTQCRSMRRIAGRISNMALSQSFGRWLDALDAIASERDQAEHEASLSGLRAEMQAQRTRLCSGYCHGGFSRVCRSVWSSGCHG